MLRLQSIITLLTLALTASAAKAGFSVERIDPPHWWAGMADSSLQLQIYGDDIAGSEVSLSPYPGVSIDSVARLDGAPCWQYIYLDISDQAVAGELTLTWSKGKKKVSRKYQLRERVSHRGAKGFSGADVLYMVMPDRFADGNPDNNIDKSMANPVGADRSDPNARHGGDLKGIADHIDYMDSLGVTALWLNPVLENDMPGGSYHGYATTDYYRIDPRFGSNDEYIALIDTLHSKGIKTVMDMIFNHVGSGHPWMKNPPASDWFNFQDNYTQTNYRLSTLTDPYASDHDRRLTVDGWFVKEMPDLNQHNPHVMKYLTQNSIWWIEEADIDAIRMDTYSYVDEDIMAGWNADVKKQYPDFTIVGECWLSDPSGTAFWQKGSMQGARKGKDSNLEVVMDFPLMLKMRDMAPFRVETNAWSGLNVLYDHMALDYNYADPLNVLRFVDNHDTERFIVTETDDLGGWKQAMAFLLTIPGVPQIYYGTEMLMSGTRAGGDGNVRKDMPGGFPGDTVSVFSPEGRTSMQQEAYAFLSRLMQWRKGSDAVARGDMKHFLPDNGLYLYTRTTPDEEVVVMLNGTDSVNTVDMSRYTEAVAPGAEFTDVITGEIIKPIDDTKKFTFAPRQTVVATRKIAR